MESIGCNVPWKNTEYTFLFDIQTTILIPLIPKTCKIVAHSRVFNKTIDKTRIAFRFDCGVDNKNILRCSSGHYAAMFMIYKGFKELNIYGCDSWFDTNNYRDSFTDSKINKPINFVKDLGTHWKKQWELMILQHKHIVFNFI